MRRNLHSFEKIKAMSSEALHARIERKLLALFAPGFFDQPVEKKAAETERTIGRAGDKIIDVERPARKQEFHNPIAGNGADFAAGLEEGESIAFFSLLLDLSDEFLPIGVVSAQLHHDGMTPANFGRRFGNTDGRFRRV
jgi:hypothetical protein